MIPTYLRPPNNPDKEELILQLSQEAEVSCAAEFVEEEGRELTDEEKGAFSHATYLATKWTSTQSVSRFAEEEGDREDLDEYPLTKRELRRQRKREKKLQKSKFHKACNECRDYVEDHWDDDGPGFILAFFGAVAWYLMIGLVVRWLIRKYFDDPELAISICQPG